MNECVCLCFAALCVYAAFYELLFPSAYYSGLSAKSGNEYAEHFCSVDASVIFQRGLISHSYHVSDNKLIDFDIVLDVETLN